MTTTDIKRMRRQMPAIAYRQPKSEDGSGVWQLIRACKPLDENSLYCNLLQCDHFGDTCVVAERIDDGAIVGWVSAYLLPKETGTLFVWQVAVDESVQGTGVGKTMLSELLGRESCDNVGILKTTITSDNAASWALFSALSRIGDGALRHEPYFRRDAHFHGRHATEHLVTITFPPRTPSDMRERWFPALDAGPAHRNGTA